MFYVKSMLVKIMYMEGNSTHDLVRIKKRISVVCSFLVGCYTLGRGETEFFSCAT